MTQPLTFSTLSKPKRELIRLLQNLNFGRIEGLQVQCGEPVLDPAPRVIRKIQIGAVNGPRPESSLNDFRPKQQIAEMLDVIGGAEDGAVLKIQVAHGLPISIEIERGEHA